MMRCVLVLLVSLVSAGLGLAQSGRTLRIIGVAANDVLNLREAPTASSRIVGIVPPGARAIAVLGAPRGAWIFVRWGDAQGWAARDLLADDSPVGRPRDGGDSASRRAGGWWLVLGSFSDPAGTPASIARVSASAGTMRRAHLLGPIRELFGLHPRLRGRGRGTLPVTIGRRGRQGPGAVLPPVILREVQPVRRRLTVSGGGRRVAALTGSRPGAGRRSWRCG